MGEARRRKLAGDQSHKGRDGDIISWAAGEFCKECGEPCEVVVGVEDGVLGMEGLYTNSCCEKHILEIMDEIDSQGKLKRYMKKCEPIG
jgi:hypothetical protein